MIIINMPRTESKLTIYKTKAHAEPLWGRISWRAKIAKDRAQIVLDRQFESRLGSDPQSVEDLAPHHVYGMPYELNNKTIAAIKTGQLSEAIVQINGAFAKTNEFLKHIVKEESESNQDSKMQSDLQYTKDQNENMREILRVYMDARSLRLDAATQQEIQNIRFDQVDERSRRDNRSYVIVRDYIRFCSSVEDMFNISEE